MSDSGQAANFPAVKLKIQNIGNVHQFFSFRELRDSPCVLVSRHIVSVSLFVTVSVHSVIERDILPFLSVRQSIRPMPVFCLNECTHRHRFRHSASGIILFFEPATTVT